MLVSAAEMLKKAKAGHYAVGQFNINNLEWTKAILQTAQEQNSPVPQSPAPANTDYRGRPIKPMWKRVLTAVAVGLYILCAIPLILFGETGFETLGLIATISIAAVATVAIIIASGGDSENSKDEKDEDEKILREAVRDLSEREQTIIRLRYGLGGTKERTQKEVADMLGISQSYISRLEKRIIARLRESIGTKI